PCPAYARAEGHRHTGMAKLLLQVAHDCAGTLSRARSVHPVDEAEEHASASSRRRDDYALGIGVLRLKKWCRVSVLIEFWRMVANRLGMSGPAFRSQPLVMRRF